MKKLQYNNSFVLAMELSKASSHEKGAVNKRSTQVQHCLTRWTVKGLVY